jgi:glutamine synthetase
VDGYELASWETGYGDFMLVPDFATLRVIPWQPATALVLADVAEVGHGPGGGDPVRVSPRQVLRAQLDRAAERGWTALAGTELEFIVYEGSYEQAWDAGYRSLTPANRYNADYSVLGTGRIEPLLRDIRNSMAGAGLYVESAKGECNYGQHEIAFLYDEVVRTADNHSVYKNGAKEIAHLNGCSITFMAKPDHSWIGSSCHIHASLWRDGENAFAGGPEVFERFLAGWIAGAAELAVFLAPTINSYKRYAAGSWAPTTLAWGHDNRTCGFRIVGHGAAQRIETRIPGGDVNPYLAFAALIAAGLYGIEQGLELPPALVGNAYESDAKRFPSTLREAIAALEEGTMARAALGDDVVDHYLNYARTEQRLFDEVVTCYERERLFERG